MEKYDVYKDIAERTGGDIFVGVVGPVRTGKSTFIAKFMENFVIPNIGNKLQRQIATDEMPQSAEGKAVMTTQPKFIPANAVKVQFKNKTTANVRLIDCVGYMIDGADNDENLNGDRMVKTPWSDTEMPFTKAAEIGTKKVIDEYSTIGVLVTTDGSFGEYKRENYLAAEEKAVGDLKKRKKPFVVVLNCADPKAKETESLSGKLEEKYKVPVIAASCKELSFDDISAIMEKILLEFPVYGFNVEIPQWLRALPADSEFIKEIVGEVKAASLNMEKMRDFTCLDSAFGESENFDGTTVRELNLGTGMPVYDLAVKEGLFYKVLSKECEEDITDDYALLSFVKEFAVAKRRYQKIKDALSAAEEEGYGVALPSIDEVSIEEPVLIKSGGKYGVKLKASAPSLHIIKVDVNTEVSPVVGTEKQSEDMVNYINEQCENAPEKIWETNVFGKTLRDIVSGDLNDKITSMPKDAQVKMRKTVTRIVNENKGGVICILL